MFSAGLHSRNILSNSEQLFASWGTLYQLFISSNRKTIMKRQSFFLQFGAMLVLSLTALPLSARDIPPSVQSRIVNGESTTLKGLGAVFPAVFVDKPSREAGVSEED